jgi:agmatinase
MRLRFASEDGYHFYDVQERRHFVLAERGVDAGDVPIYPSDQPRTFKAIEDAVAAVGRIGALPVLLGGDNSITYPSVRGLKRPDVTVVQFDAHLDYADEYFTVEHSNATPMRRLRQSGAAARIIHCGIRGFDNHPDALAATEAAGNLVLTTQDCRSGTAEQALRNLDEETPIYVCLDIDVADPSAAPGTGYPEPGGLDYDTLRRLFAALAERAVLVGCEIVEVAPAYDPSGRTPLLAAHWLIDLLGRLPREI